MRPRRSRFQRLGYAKAHERVGRVEEGAGAFDELLTHGSRRMSAAADAADRIIEKKRARLETPRASSSTPRSTPRVVAMKEAPKQRRCAACEAGEARRKQLVDQRKARDAERARAERDARAAELI